MAAPKKTKLTLDVIKRLPKAELHCHLDGSVRLTTIIELAREQDVALPTMDVNELKKLVTVDYSCTSLEEYLRGFDITLKVLQKPYAITRAMYEVAEDAAADGVRYLEVRFSPILHVQEGLSLSGVMEAVCEGQVLAELHLPITVRIIVCGMRQMPAKVTKDLAEIAWRYRHKGVVGFDLAGPEKGFNSKHHREAFAMIREKCINCTLHAGEGFGWESIWDSIRYCGAHRIGHGVRLYENESLMRFVADRRIALECCVSSNVHTKAVKTLQEHPIRKFFDAGVIVCPGCDNCTVSNVTLSGEYELLQNQFGFTIEEIVRMIDYGFQASFLTSTARQRMRAEALHECIRVLKEEGYDISGIEANQRWYYDWLGVGDLDRVGVTPRGRLWGPHRNPPITAEIIRHLPKADLHCRLDGSVSLELMYKELCDAKIDTLKRFGVQISSVEDLRKVFQPNVANGDGNGSDHAPHTRESLLLAKRISKSVLQTKDQLERGVDDILRHAIEDGVVYLELVLRPLTHTAGGLTARQVVDIVLWRVEGFTRAANAAGTPLTVGVVLYASTTADDPLAFRQIAEMAVEARGRGVVGFGVYGDDDIAPESMKYFTSTFDYLKSHNMNIAFVAGVTSPGSIIAALGTGGATRLSGAFTAHTFPRLMSYLASNNIPVEISDSAKLRSHTTDVRSFVDPIRLYIDNGVSVALCSFRHSTMPLLRNETIARIVAKCHLSISELLALLVASLRTNFQPWQVRQKMVADFSEKARNFLVEKGFKYFTRLTYFPPQTKLAKSFCTEKDSEVN